MSDFSVENHGSIYLIRARTDDARRWLQEHTADDAIWFGWCLVVEHRYVRHLVEGMWEAGFENDNR